MSKLNSSSLDYSSILTMSWDNVPVPKLLPVGSWRLRVKSVGFQAPKSKDGSPNVMFTYEVQEPMNDVDDAALAELGDYDYAMQPIFNKFFIKGAADLHRLREHIKKHDVELEGMTVSETLKALQGSDVIAYLSHDTYVSKDGKQETTMRAAGFTSITEFGA